MLALPRGNAKMIEIASAIQTGAITFLRQEYTWCSLSSCFGNSPPFAGQRFLALFEPDACCPARRLLCAHELHSARHRSVGAGDHLTFRVCSIWTQMCCSQRRGGSNAPAVWPLSLE